MKNIKSSLLIILLTLVYSCSNSPSDIDVSNINIPAVKIKRLDQAIFEIDTTNMNKSIQSLQSTFGDVYQIYITSLINKGGRNDTSNADVLKNFISDEGMQEVYADTKIIYPKIDDIEAEFTNVFKHYNYYYPNGKIPSIVSIISGFKTGNVTIDNNIIFGLEMYLGKDNKFYSFLQLQLYRTKFMNKHNLVPDAVKDWIMFSHPDNMNKKDFLSEIIYNGKVMYMLDALMPAVHDSIKMQYSQEHLNYCIQNEFNIWSYFVAQKLLYTTDQSEIKKYTSVGPFTTALSKNSAPRIGYWIGWQIVKQYMRENPKVTLPQLMNETDAQTILTKAKYKPKK